MSAAQALRGTRPSDRITIVSADPQPYYYRAALTNYLMGEIQEEELWSLHPEQWESLRLERIVDRATGFRPETNELMLHDGGAMQYDRLLIATGARARRLEPTGKYAVKGADLPGVMVMRTMQDTRELVDRASRAKKAVVIGGGILGIEAAQGLHARNVDVSLVHRGDWLLERVVDQTAGDLIRARMQADGVGVFLGAETEEIEGSGRGIKGVRLKSGEFIECSLVITSIGILPNTEWLADSPVTPERGYLTVNRQMQLGGMENVYAAGDIVHFREASLPFDNPGGLWQPAVRQGRIAGLNMAGEDGDPPIEYRPGPIYNGTRAWDLDLGTVGTSVHDPGKRYPDDECESVVYRDRHGGRPIYKRALLHKGQLVGAILLGDRREGMALRRLMNLRGQAANVKAVAERLFEPDFDLFRWIAAQEEADGVRRFDDEGAMMAVAAKPQAMAQATNVVSQRDCAQAVEGQTEHFGSLPPPPLKLMIGDQTHTVDKGSVRLGPKGSSDIAIPEAREVDRLLIKREGMAWFCTRAKRAAGTALINGRPLGGLGILSDGDVIQLGRQKILVGLKRASEIDEAPTKPEPSYQLVNAIDGTPHDVGRGTTTIGADPDNDIVLNDPGIERYHAQIQARGTPRTYYLVDCGGHGKTKVGSNKLTGHCRLDADDKITLGDASFVFSSGGVRPEHADRHAATATIGASDLGFLYLVCTSGPLKGSAVAVPVPGIIGRGLKADAQINDPLLSRLHARVDGIIPVVKLIDLGSQNGTKLDGRRLAPNEPRTTS